MSYHVTDICLLVANIPRSLAFYRDQLGFAIKREDIGFAEFEGNGGACLALWEAENVAAHLGPQVFTGPGHRMMGAMEFATAAELEAVYAQLQANGVHFVTAMADWPWGARAAYFADPDGYLWEIYAWVNEPYTW